MLPGVVNTEHKNRIDKEHMITVTPYQKEDQEAVLNLILTIQREEFEFPITEADQPDLNNIEGYYQTGNGQFWVAKMKDEIVGTISLLDLGNNDTALRKMFVKEAYRGGEYQVAKTLLATLIAWSEGNDVKNIYLGTTEKFKAAHRFYEKNGFARLEREELPKTFEFMAVDTRFYQRNLP